MGKCQAKKKKARGAGGPLLKTKHRRKDVDQIYDELQKEQPETLAIDRDLPGQGQFMCAHCARYFISKDAMEVHNRTKLHKRRIKDLKTKPYSIEESLAAAGMGPPDNGPRLGVRQPTQMQAEMNLDFDPRL